MNGLALHPITGISLCAGIGGFELGLRLALGDRYRTVCYVEREAYAAGRLAALAVQGYLDEAPIWDDLRTFDGLPFCDRVHIIAAGFPCQPFSQAGPRTGTADPRWLWPRIIEIVRDVRPAYVFLENSPQVRKQALPIILRDLSRAGFDAEWDLFSAVEAGYPHLRKRFFLLASHPDRIGQQQPGGTLGEGGGWTGDGAAQDAADALGPGCPPVRGRGVSAEGGDATPGGDRGAVAADTDQLDADHRGHGASTPCGERPGQTYLSGGEGPECAFWCAQSRVCVLDDGSPYRLDEIRALGNAVIPAVVARAWRELHGRFIG